MEPCSELRMSGSNRILDLAEALDSYGFSRIEPGAPEAERPERLPRPLNEFRDLVRASGARLALEIGSWEGSSAVAWAEACAADEGAWAIVCVDTWLGSPEMRRNLDGQQWSRQRLFLEDGYPSVFRTFVSNVRRSHFAEHIYPMPMDSSHAQKLLYKLGLRFDLVYIDGGHDFESVYGDLHRALKLLDAENANALICGDDYHESWAEVQYGANVFARNMSLSLHRKGTQFALTTGRASSAQGVLRAASWTKVV